MPRRFKGWSPFSIFLLAASFVVIIFYLSILEDCLEFDTRALISEVIGDIGCIQSGIWVNCRAAGQFPLLQKIPALLVYLLGAKPNLVIRLLSIINLVAFCSTLIQFHQSFKNSSRILAWTGLGVLIFGPLPWYGRSSFGEMLACWATVSFLICWTDRKPLWKSGLFLFLAGISKETATPFLLLLAVAAVPFRQINKKGGPSPDNQRDFLKLVAASVAAIGANLAFNFHRFGTVLNLQYLKPSSMVQDWRDRISFFGAIWVSPHGGLLIFWPTFTALFLPVVGYLLFKSRGRSWRSKYPLIICILVLGGLTVGFSKWWAPLGWRAWGSRLIFPWIPAVLYLVLKSYTNDIETLIRYWLRSSRAFWSIGLGLVISNFPQFHSLFSWSLMDAIFIPPEPKCVGDLQLEVHGMAIHYYCMDKMFWPHDWILRKAYYPSFDPTSFCLSILGSLIFIAWLLRMRRLGQGSA